MTAWAATELTPSPPGDGGHRSPRRHSTPRIVTHVASRMRDTAARAALAPRDERPQGVSSRYPSAANAGPSSARLARGSPRPSRSPTASGKSAEGSMPTRSRAHRRGAAGRRPSRSIRRRSVLPRLIWTIPRAENGLRRSVDLPETVNPPNRCRVELRAARSLRRTPLSAAGRAAPAPGFCLTKCSTSAASPQLEQSSRRCHPHWPATGPPRGTRGEPIAPPRPDDPRVGADRFGSPE